MKKTALLHPEISEVIASLGHSDQLVLADAGLPIPAGTRRIDLALTRGIPSFMETLEVVLTEMKVERVILAEEIRSQSPHILGAIQEALPQIPIEFIPHAAFKSQTQAARAIIRTGEFTPYANIILSAGVVF